MFGSAILKGSGHQRSFWLTVALSVMLLVSVSITIAHAANPTRLAYDLKRDLGALRVQLELIDPLDREGTQQTTAFNADLGDGGPAFRRHSLVTMVASANRRLERLIESYREEGNEDRVRTAATLRLAMYELRHQVDHLARTAKPGEATVIRERIVATLDRSERDLDDLLRPGKKAPAPARPD